MATVPTFTLQPYTGYTTPVVSVYSDQTALATSANITRQSYAMLADVYINDNNVGTLKAYPFNGLCELNPQKITENYLLHDFNYNCVGVSGNSDSIKRINTVLGETFSRVLSFTSITNDSGRVLLNCDTNFFLSIGDRILIVKDNPSVNPQYNTFSSTHFVGDSGILTDIPYSYTPITETGIVYEGAEWFDFSYIGGVVGVTTTNPHYFNVGDVVYVQMDNVSTGIVQLNSGTNGSITSLTIGGVNILDTPVPFTTDIPTTIGALEFVIGASNSGFTAYQYYSSFPTGGSNKLHIYSQMNQGQTTNGLPIVITTTGDLNFSYSPAMFITSGVDSATGEGWNPQFTGTYTVTSVPSATTFLVDDLPVGFNNEPGSQRGSIYSLNNYVFTGQTSGETYWIMNNSNRYLYDNYSETITGYTTGFPSSEFLTNKPRTSFSFLDFPNASLYNYYSTNDIATVDILINPNGIAPLNYMYVQTFSGNNINAGSYLISLSSFTDSITSSTDWERFSIGVGAWNLNNIPHSEYIYFTPPPAGNMITDDKSFYSVAFYSGDTTPDILGGYIMTEGLIFNRKCPTHKYFQLIWLNKWGAFDYYPLTGSWNDTLNVTRMGYERKRESVQSSNRYGYSPIDRGVTDFNIKSNLALKLNTDWMTLTEAQWFSEVFESPQVFIYSPQDGNPNTIEPSALYPVNVLDTEVNIPNERSRMKNFEINVQLSSRRINQIN